MSIAIGIYDLFSYLIPGALYLYLINDFLRVVGWQYIDLTKSVLQGMLRQVYYPSSWSELAHMS